MRSDFVLLSCFAINAAFSGGYLGEENREKNSNDVEEVGGGGGGGGGGGE